MTRTFRSLDDVAAAIGMELGPTPHLMINQDRIDAFADATGDDQWIHVDPARAAAGPYGATVAHGYLTLSLLPHFARQLFRLEFGTARINYGLNTVRFPAPVLVGSAIRAAATIVDLRREPAKATLTIRYVIQIDGTAKPACVAEALTVLL